ncbi:hypothetical protein AALC17_16880, partial [Oscillospiraceae bacterium 38-13]
MLNLLWFVISSPPPAANHTSSENKSPGDYQDKLGSGMCGIQAGNFVLRPLSLFFIYSGAVLGLAESEPAAKVGRSPVQQMTRNLSMENHGNVNSKCEKNIKIFERVRSGVSSQVKWAKFRHKVYQCRGEVSPG